MQSNQSTKSNEDAIQRIRSIIQNEINKLDYSSDNNQYYRVDHTNKTIEVLNEGIDFSILLALLVLNNDSPIGVPYTLYATTEVGIITRVSDTEFSYRASNPLEYVSVEFTLDNSAVIESLSRGE